MEYTRELVETKTVESTFTHQDREETLNWSEDAMHSKEQLCMRNWVKLSENTIR